MGVIKDNLFGRLSGRVGDTCYRDCKDKTVVASRPHRDKNDHPNCAAPKDRLACASKLASYINKIQPLNEIWTIAGSGSSDAYHSLMSSNINASDRQHLTNKNIISPPGLPLRVSDVEISDGFINAHLEISGSHIPSPLKAVLLLYAYNPVSEKTKYFRFYHITSEVSKPGNGSAFDLKFNPYPFTLNWLGGYNKYIMYFTMVKDGGTTPVVWTSTAAYESTFNILLFENESRTE